MPYFCTQPDPTNPTVKLYRFEARSKIIRWGVTSSWRNNITEGFLNSLFTRQHGTKRAAGGFAVFPGSARVKPKIYSSARPRRPTQKRRTALKSALSKIS
jgi:hypothetical protein